MRTFLRKQRFLLAAWTVAGLLAGAVSGVARTVELSLDGNWEIVFDHGNIGRAAGWHRDKVFARLDHRRTISVPSAWELVEQDYEGAAFYRHEFEIPADWAGKVVRLQFGAVNYIAEIYVNDEAIGIHEGGFTPFELRIDRVLKPGVTNVLLLRVQGPIILSDQRVDGIGPLETPQWRGGITGGIWQSVRLVATDEVHVKDVFLRPDWHAGTVTVEVELDQTARYGRQVEAILDITAAQDPSKKIATQRRQLDLHPGLTIKSWTTPIPHPRAWSPDDPFLYRAEIRLIIDGKQSDRWSQRFGLREFTIEHNRFHLNGTPLYLKATFLEGLYPCGIAMPDSEAMARREIELAKEAGFNMIRPWRHPPAPMWLDLADEMGVLVVASPAVECMRLPLSTPSLPARVENEIRELVLRDRNRTCVVQWELFNELHRPILKQMMRPMALLVRDLDPTRLILDESGGWAFGANLYLPRAHEPVRFNDIHNYPGPLVNQSLYTGYLAIGATPAEQRALGFDGTAPGRNVAPGRMSFVSELGYGSLPNLPRCNDLFAARGQPFAPAYRYYRRVQKDQEQVLKNCGFDYLYPEFEPFCLMQQSIHGAANKRMIEAVRSNPRVAGYCIHALCAGDWVFGAGLIDIWRNPKTEVYASTQAANQARIVSIRVVPRNVYAARGATLTVTGINDLESIGARLSVRMFSADGKRMLEKIEGTQWRSGISNLFRSPLETRALQGTYRVEVTVQDSHGALITANEHTFDVFADEDLFAPKDTIAVLDTDRKLTPFLKATGIRYLTFDASTPVSVPVFVTDIRASGEAQRSRFDELFSHIEKGGTAVYVGAMGMEGDPDRPPETQVDPVPVKGKIIDAQGLWTCIPHLVKDHPIFAGLPVNGPMREIFENVWSKQTVAGLGGETVVASVGFEWFSWDHTLLYSGPGTSWWGSDLAIVPYGEGRCILSQLRMVENLGTDPVADKLLFNLINFVSE